MHCPFCGEEETKVIDSRLVSDGAQVRRRRECIHCNDRFTTYETAELTLPRVVKRDGQRSPFSEDKLRSGMLRALEKRPVSVQQIEDALTRIKHKCRTKGEREVKASWIGEQVMLELRSLDQVAYVRFASVYRSFENVNEFKEEISRLENLDNEVELENVDTERTS